MHASFFFSDSHESITAATFNTAPLSHRYRRWIKILFPQSFPTLQLQGTLRVARKVICSDKFYLRSLLSKSFIAPRATVRIAREIYIYIYVYIKRKLSFALSLCGPGPSVSSSTQPGRAITANVVFEFSTCYLLELQLEVVVGTRAKCLSAFKRTTCDYVVTRQCRWDGNPEVFGITFSLIRITR